MKTNTITRNAAPRTRAKSSFMPLTSAIALWPHGMTASAFGYVGAATTADMVTVSTPAVADFRVIAKQARPPRGVPR